MKYFTLIMLTFFVSSCATQPSAPVRTSSAVSKPFKVAPALPPSTQNIYSSKNAFYPISKQIQCVPHARKVSGIPIRGNAHTWWSQAKGNYERGAKPKKGAVMVLSKTKRLRYGHLAVVKSVVNSRSILVEHANWGGDLKSRKIVYKRMPVKDVSKNNDWSRVRFYNYPSGSYGSVYINSGFIYAP